ncbi:uncharacterized, partial [Tachysurus ichikawai]
KPGRDNVLSSCCTLDSQASQIMCTFRAQTTPSIDRAAEWERTVRAEEPES